MRLAPIRATARSIRRREDARQLENNEGFSTARERLFKKLELIRERMIARAEREASEEHGPAKRP